jgi:acyl carrier protein
MVQPKSSLFNRIATELSNPEQMLKAMSSRQRRARPELEGGFVPPRTSVEEVLAGIWAQVLGLEQVGVHDNFFHLGGHSLLGMQVISQVRDTFQVELLPHHFFDRPTVAALAQAVEAQQAEQAANTRLAQALERLKRQETDSPAADDPKRQHFSL